MTPCQSAALQSSTASPATSTPMKQGILSPRISLHSSKTVPWKLGVPCCEWQTRAHDSAKTTPKAPGPPRSPATRLLPPQTETAFILRSKTCAFCLAIDHVVPENELSMIWLRSLSVGLLVDCVSDRKQAFSCVSSATSITRTLDKRDLLFLIAHTSSP
jgi:hypothetical protein